MNDNVLGRLARGKQTAAGPVSPQDAVSRALFFAGTGQILPSTQPKAVDPLDTQLKMQRLLTGTPEAKLERAKAMGGLKMEQEDQQRQTELQRLKDAGLIADDVAQTPSDVSPNRGIEGLASSLSPISKQPSIGQPLPSMSSTKGPKYIAVPDKLPGTQFSEKYGVNVKTPGTFKAELDPEYKNQQEVQLANQKKEGEMNLKRKDFKNALDSFTAVGNSIPRKFGAERFEQGINNIQSRVMQEEGDPLAAASSTYEGARKNLRVAVARLKDVGNLSETEQAAAGLLVPTDIDSPEVYQTKITYLNALAGASTPEEIKRLINSFASGQQAPQAQVQPQGTSKYKIVSVE